MRRPSGAGKKALKRCESADNPMVFHSAPAPIQTSEKSAYSDFTFYGRRCLQSFSFVLSYPRLPGTSGFLPGGASFLPTPITSLLPSHR